MKGLLVDFGGVLTTNVFDSFRLFCRSEGLDADAITTDGEDLTADAPETWKPADEDESHDERLRAERPDVGESDGPTHPVDPAGPDDEPRDQIDQLDPEGETRVLGED